MKILQFRVGAVWHVIWRLRVKIHVILSGMEFSPSRLGQLERRETRLKNCARDFGGATSKRQKLGSKHRVDVVAQW